jgi:hypothetical protein
MLRFAALCAALGLVAFSLALPVSADEKAPPIDEIMKKLHGKAGSHKVIGKGLDAAELDWEAIAKHAKIYSDLAASLDKNTPEKGDKKAWDKLSQGVRQGRQGPGRGGREEGQGSGEGGVRPAQGVVRRLPREPPLRMTNDQ